jgi:hypothetical protein
MYSFRRSGSQTDVANEASNFEMPRSNQRAVMKAVVIGCGFMGASSYKLRELEHAHFRLNTLIGERFTVLLKRINDRLSFGRAIEKLKRAARSAEPAVCDVCWHRCAPARNHIKTCIIIVSAGGTTTARHSIIGVRK